MKISYNNLKRYKKDLKNPEDLARDLVMHTAEVEEIVSCGASFENIVFGVIKSIENHPDADSLKVCMVDVGEKENLQIVCGGNNLRLEQGVAVAKIGATVSWHGEETITMKKTKIRGVESNGMICASEEIGLKNEFPADDPKAILDFGDLQTKPGTNLAELLNKNDYILEIDNKAINHRPDLFSHIGILREIYAISGEKFDYDYLDLDFSGLKDLGIQNEIKEVKRYIGLEISGVKNIESPDYIKEVLQASGNASKGLLIDLSNYSLYFYGQPTHIFDADKIDGNIVVRHARDGETILALDDKEYELTNQDIVIADSKKVLAIAGIIGAKNSAVSDSTTNIIIESANFPHEILRASGKRLGVRTDALNIFEKDLLPISAKWGVSLIVSELQKVFTNMKLESYSDIYGQKQEQVEVEYDFEFINNLIGKKYDENTVLSILKNLGIEIVSPDKGIKGLLRIPFWRKELNFKADIAEEIARIDGYDAIESLVPEIQLGAIIQSNIYKAKKISRNFFVQNGFFDMYTYSFVNNELMQKCNSNVENCVPLKNFLSEDATHMKNSLIPNLLLSLEKNSRDFKELKLFEVEKIFNLEANNNILEKYSLAGVMSLDKDNLYYETQNLIKKFLENLFLNKYDFKKETNLVDFAHLGRTSQIIVRGQKIGVLGEIKPKVLNNFSIKNKVGFFEIDLEILAGMLGNIQKAKELSEFQGSQFDISFLVDKNFEAKKLYNTILKTSPIIEKVDLFDIYENEEKIPGKRSVAFKVYLQKMDSEITDKDKNELIQEIIKRAEKLSAIHK